MSVVVYVRVGVRARLSLCFGPVMSWRWRPTGLHNLSKIYRHDKVDMCYEDMTKNRLSRNESHPMYPILPFMTICLANEALLRIQPTTHGDASD